MLLFNREKWEDQETQLGTTANHTKNQKYWLSCCCLLLMPRHVIWTFKNLSTIPEVSTISWERLFWHNCNPMTEVSQEESSLLILLKGSFVVVVVLFTLSLIVYFDLLLFLSFLVYDFGSFLKDFLNST